MDKKEYEKILEMYYTNQNLLVGYLIRKIKEN